MAEVTIKKAKIKDNLYLEVEFSEVVKDGTNEVKKVCTAHIHDDLRLAFRRLNTHMALLTEQAIETAKKAVPVCYGDDEERQREVQHFKFDDRNLAIAKETACSGFTIGGTGDHEGVTLIGRRTLTAARILNLVSPFLKWTDDIYDYKHLDDLSEIIEACKGEVKLYLFEGKHAPDNQLKLFEAETQTADEEQ